MKKSKEYYEQKTNALYDKLHQLSDPDDIIYVRNQIVELNMRLVSTVLKKYEPYTVDQLQIGYIGLIKAADTYDRVRSIPFSSYACFIIEREIHKDYNERSDSIEEKLKNNMLYLDDKIRLPNGDEMDQGSLIEDTEATKFMESFIEDNELQGICENIIKPAIVELSARGRNSVSKINFDVWEKLEFRYIMSIIFEESQKKRFNLTQMAKECNISLPNVRQRHIRVMDEVFQRMWEYMTLTFTELFERLRGKHNVPARLLCLDPGKTTGWCLFEYGELTEWGQIPDCYDDNNIDISGFMELFDRTQPDFILYEDYRVYAHKMDRHSYSPVMTVRLIGTIETYCQMNNIKAHKQMATTAKNFCTDEKLKAWGFWQKGMRHARDAIRHGTYFLLFYKKGQDIL